MTSRMRRKREALRHWSHFLAGILIGVMIWTPVLAASDFVPDPRAWTNRLMHGDWIAIAITAAILLAIIGVALGFLTRNRPLKPATADPENSIGRYRPFRDL
jgi:hypothetical protein